jgi:hypothetical protein
VEPIGLFFGAIDCINQSIATPGCTGERCKLLPTRQNRGRMWIIKFVIYLTPHFLQQGSNLQFAGNWRFSVWLQNVVNTRIERFTSLGRDPRFVEEPLVLFVPNSGGGAFDDLIFFFLKENSQTIPNWKDLLRMSTAAQATAESSAACRFFVPWRGGCVFRLLRVLGSRRARTRPSQGTSAGLGTEIRDFFEMSKGIAQRAVLSLPKNLLETAAVNA